jgi:multimeric flavodoxin WrbA
MDLLVSVSMTSVLGIIGSRDRGGRTARAAEALLMGAGDEGVSWDACRLPAMDMRRCRQCDEDGWGDCRRLGTCVQEDEFAGLLARLREASAAVLATPVYFSDLSESMKAFTDRLRRVCAHPASRRDRLEGKPAIGVCVAGGSGGGAVRCALVLERVLLDCGFDVVDMIPVRRQNLDAKKPALELAGRWLAEICR